MQGSATVVASRGATPESTCGVEQFIGNGAHPLGHVPTVGPLTSPVMQRRVEVHHPQVACGVHSPHDVIALHGSLGGPASTGGTPESMGPTPASGPGPLPG